MTASLLQWEAESHIYLLRHPTEEWFRIGSAVNHKSRRSVLKDSWVSTSSYFAQFPKDSRDFHRASAEIKKLVAIRRATPVSPKERYTWYRLEAMESLLAYLRDFTTSGAVALRPLEDLMPEDVEKAQALRKAEDAFFEQKALERAALAAEQKAVALAARHAEFQAFVGRQLEADTWMTRSEVRPSVLSMVNEALVALNNLCSGYCKLVRHRDGRMGLAVSVNEAKNDALMEIVSRLFSFTVFSRTPSEDEKELKVLKANRLFEKFILPEYQHQTYRFIRCEISLNLESSVIKEAVLSLTPGIRGWDLPSNATVLNYVFSPPNPDKNLISVVTLLAQNKKVWLTAAKAERAPPAALRPRLKQLGLLFNWGPPAIRYVENSSYEGDEGAPLMLCRLSREHAGEPITVGFQKINLSTGESQLCFFPGLDESAAFVCVWKPKAVMALVASVADAIRINSSRELPTVVAPTAQALAEFDVPTECETLYVFLPDNDEWTAAAHALSSRVLDIPVILGLMPEAGG